MSPGTEQRKLAANMFTGMVGHSAWSQRDEALALELVEVIRGTPKTTAATDRGLWLREGSGPLTPVLREGDLIGGKTVKTLVAFASGNGSPGQGRGWLRKPAGSGAVVSALAFFTDKSQGLLGGFIGGVTSSFPDFASLGLPATDGAGNPAFLASLPLGGGVTKANARGVFLSDGIGGYTQLARLGGDAGNGAKFTVLKDPVLASDGGIAFPATIKGGNVRGPGTTTIWWGPPGVKPGLLAQGGAQWKGFASLAIAGGRGPIFAATLVPNRGGVTAKNATGVWACDLTGAPRVLFRTGDAIGGKTLKSFILLNATIGSTGVTRSFNDNAQVVWLATFTDRSTAILTTEVP